MNNFEAISIRYDGSKLEILDQQLLPDQEEWLEVTSPAAMIKIIKALKVRGAPLIGVSASLSLALWAEKAANFDEFMKMSQEVKEARPTAVNLMNCVDRLVKVANDTQMDIAAIRNAAYGIYEEDVDLCEQMATAGAELITSGDEILTHCNTGGLATAGVGTALGVICKAYGQGKKIQVYVDETRPLLQGGRLTTWELKKAGVPYTLICDNMAASLMREGKVTKIFVGADRIAVNGDFANKIGTYGLAVLADHHDIPLYVVAPRTTIDFDCATGEEIPVEERKKEEVQGVAGSFGSVRWAPADAPVYNPAFDVTPYDLVAGYVIDGNVVDRKMIEVGDLQKFQLI